MRRKQKYFSKLQVANLHFLELFALLRLIRKLTERRIEGVELRCILR